MTDSLRGDWQYRTGIGWFLALPLILALPAWFSFDSFVAIALGLVGIFVLVGYGRRILVASVVDPALPAVDDWVALGRSVVVATVVLCAFVALPTVVVGLALWVDASPMADAVSDLAAVTITGIAFATGAYLTPAVLAVSGRPRATSGSGTRRRLGSTRRAAVGSVVTSRDYVVATLQAVLISFTVGAATLMLLVTVFGLVFLPAVVFLALVVTARRYAYAVDRALDPSTIEALDERTMPWL